MLKKRVTVFAALISEKAFGECIEARKPLGLPVDPLLVVVMTGHAVASTSGLSPSPFTAIFGGFKSPRHHQINSSYN